jgi:hypothetical protein
MLSSLIGQCQYSKRQGARQGFPASEGETMIFAGCPGDTRRIIPSDCGIRQIGCTFLKKG